MANIRETVPTTSAATPEILRYADLDHDGAQADAIRRIFFASSATREFASVGERDAFEQRWLGVYLERFPDACFLAREAGAIVGYLAGSFSAADDDPRFVAQGYHPLFRDVTDKAPAHLHINVDPQHRSSGIGSRLIDAFVAAADVRNVSGIHAVTADGARNVAFYDRNLFVSAATGTLGAARLACLVRMLQRNAPSSSAHHNSQ